MQLSRLTFQNYFQEKKVKNSNHPLWTHSLILFEKLLAGKLALKQPMTMTLKINRIDL